VFTAPPQGSVINIEFIQDGTGGHSVTWPSSVKWGGGAPTVNLTAGAKSFVTMWYDGSDYVPFGYGGIAVGASFAAV
jgi:hypothetical protein